MSTGKILSDSNLVLKIINLDLENMSDSAMLSAFVFLNLPELEIDAIKKYSSDFAKLIVWCQAVVSYHILIHPYTYRNEKSMISFGSDVIETAQMYLQTAGFENIVVEKADGRVLNFIKDGKFFGSTEIRCL